MDEAKFVSELIGNKIFTDCHILEGVEPMSKDDLAQMYLNTVMRPALTVTGIDGLPPVACAGNVIRASTKAQVSIRLPPGCDADTAQKVVEEKLLNDIPYKAQVTLSNWMNGNGFAAKQLEPWLQTAVDKASEQFYGEGNVCRSYGIGGSIPFLYTLGEKFPNT